MTRIGSKTILSNSPLVLVLCQVRFSPLLAMDRYMGDIQDELRRRGYPINASDPVNEFGAGGRASPQRTRRRWEFLDQNKRLGVVLHEGFVTVQTTAYQDFDQFLPRVMDVVATVSKEVGGLFVTRVGLRYVDVVLPRKHERWQDYLKPGFAGFSGRRFLADSTLQLHQVIGRTEVGGMHVRLLQNRDGDLLPPDLADTKLELPDHLGASVSRRMPAVDDRGESRGRDGSLVTILDVDNFCDLEPEAFDRAHVESKAWALKNIAWDTFREEIASDHAMQVWR